MEVVSSNDIGIENDLIVDEGARQREIEILQQEFSEQLKEFASDRSIFDEYKQFTPREKDVIVKVFKFTPSNNKSLGEKHVILMKNDMTGEFTPRTVAQKEKIYPIVRLIAVNETVRESLDLEVGALYTVPVEEITGTSFNPEFLHLMQNFAKQGKQGSFVNVPEDMPQRLPNIEIQWQNYKFPRPDRVGDVTENDRLVFLIPSLKLKTRYELAQ